MCVDSLISVGYDGDFLFITKNFKSILTKTFCSILSKVHFLIPSSEIVNSSIKNKLIQTDSDRVFSSSNKLKIFEFEHIYKYEKIIYSDIDILWLKNPQDMFDSINNHQISLSEEAELMSKDYYSVNLISKSERDYINTNCIKGCSGGIFGFVSQNVSIIKNIYNYFADNLDKVDGLFEQPFINMFLFKHNLYNTNFSSFVDHRGYYVKYSNKHVIHFAGGPGTFEQKSANMKRYISENNIQMNSKIDIIYRCCESEVRPPFKYIRPQWFNKIKCLNTFLKSIEKSSDKINSVTFLHDGDIGELYKNIPKQYNVELVKFYNNEKSLLKSFDIADSQDGEIVYFVEDDYLHLENSINVIYEGVKKFKLVNGYDHLDRYIRTDDLTKDKESISFLTETNCHWRTAESTCCTWACTRTMWDAIKNSARHYKLEDRKFFRNLIKNNIRLWTPMHGVTTQVDDKLSPGIDWQNVA